MQPIPEFAALLRRHRLLAGLSQEALAERARLSVRGISDLERGLRRAPHPATIARLADALQLDSGAREALLMAATGQPSTESEIATPPGAPVLAAEAPEQPGMPRAEERRWVTVLAVQFVGFAALAEHLDPEDLRALADESAERIADEIHRLDGTVLRSTGDSALAVFGAPVAHEDDAERAVRAALAIRDFPLHLPHGAQGTLKVRAGLDTGEVLAVRQGPDAQPQYALIGGPVSVAAGLASGGTASAVLVSESTYRATYQHVRYQAVPPVESQELNRPHAEWAALDVVPVPPPRALGHAPFVGRDQELDVLVGALGRVVREERPQLVSVLGEPGIGKSRLIAEFEQRSLAPTNVRVLHGRCAPYGEAVGYRALTMALYDLAGIMPADDAPTARTKLQRLVRDALQALPQDDSAREIERHIALLCGLDTEQDRTATPTDERSVHVSVRRLLEAFARSQPLCLVIDDLNWADEALVNLLEHVAERAHAAPLLIVTQARPELLEKWPTWGGGIRAFTSLLLEPLDTPAGEALASELCRDRGVSVENAGRIGRLAGGNPLFAEELCAALAEGRQAAGVPIALRPLISARLDALPSDERRVLLRAAVLGKHVWQGGLAALDVDGEGSEHLDALEQRDLLRSQPGSRFGPQREYVFKHDLIQEMAYGLLSRAERRRLHARIVDWLEDASGERVEENLDLLAHHAVNAERHERALDYLARAAERSRRAAAYREEAALLEQAIQIAQRSGHQDLVPDFRARRGRALARVTLWADARQELEAALAGLPADRPERRAEVLVDLALASNWSLDEAALRQCATEALELAGSVGRADLAMDARFWLAWASGSEGDVGSAIEQYHAAVVETNELGVAVAPSVLPLFSTALCWAGRFQLAIDRGREAVRIAREAGDTDSTILALQVLGLALAGTGAYDEAWQVFDEAIRFGRDYGVGPFLARAMAMSAGYHLDVFDFEGHAETAEEACELARSFNFAPPLVSASIDLLLNLARRGEVGRAEKLVPDVAGLVERGSAWHGWMWNMRFTQARAEIALAAARFEDAIAFTDTALRLARGRRPKYEALGLVARSSGLVELGRRSEAVADLRHAVGIARSVGDPALFLRSASALLAIDPSDELASEASRTVALIRGRLPTTEMRQRFESRTPLTK